MVGVDVEHQVRASSAPPLVSVVMSVFNGGEYLREAVQSIRDQSFEDFEFVVIDDGSTDGSSECLRRLERLDDRIRVFSQDRKGLIRSLNRGCGVARGRYIARMDADDVACKERLELQLEYLRSNPDVGLVGGAVNFIDASGRLFLTARYPTSDHEIRRALPDGSVFWHPTVMFKREVFARCGGYRNIKDAEDYDLWLRMATECRLANLSNVVLKYRVHPMQVSVVRCSQQALGTLAARASADSRKRADPDPFEGEVEISAERLREVGVDECSLQTTIARAYLSSIRNMSLLGKDVIALNMLQALHAPGFEQAETWVVADLHLCAAALYRSRGEYARSLQSYWTAVSKRPILVGRPLKKVIGSITRRT